MESTIYLLGLSYGIKPRIILETLSSFPIWKERKFVYITDSWEGVAVEFCKENNIEIVKVDFNDIESDIDYFKNKDNKLLVCIGWNKKLPSGFLSLFERAINCHGGLLPDYRGDKAYMHSYANIEDSYGATIHYMNNKLDDGRIVSQGKLKLYVEETPEIIHRRISEISGMLLPDAIKLVESGYAGEQQIGEARYFYKMSREEMERIRMVNIKNMQLNEPKLTTDHKSWRLN
ncbi:formyltransferase family protein [Jeotgalibaca sp. A122]|uniref:formyltransferase family protein n=1 Tax=Jeotgalibaca sp. A122 TaxID=3457322 RepID=UPI003FCF7B10